MSRVPPEPQAEMTMAEVAVELHLASQFEQLQWTNLLLQPMPPDLNDLRCASLDSIERRKTAIAIASEMFRSFARLSDAEALSHIATLKNGTA